MTYKFDPAGSLIVVWAGVSGPLGLVSVRLALDTGATGIIIDPFSLVHIGYDLTALPLTTTLNTANGPVNVPSLAVTTLSCLGVMATNVRVAAHDVQTVGIDGLLGLDFLRGYVLTADFQNGEISLTP
jgi:predicted aspartyl protease